MRVVYGRHPVQALLEVRPSEVRRLLVTSDAAANDLVRLAQQAGVRVETADRKALEAITKNPHHQGLVAEAADYPYASLEALADVPGDALVLALDSIQDPQNLGALIRSAEGFGARAVLLPQDRAAGVTPAAIKASAGAIERMTLVRVVNLARALESLKEQGFWVTGLAGEGDEELPSVDLTGRTVLVVGAEGEGLRPGIRKHCDRLARIPMTGLTGSFNASVAGAIALYEAQRQRSAGRPSETA